MKQLVPIILLTLAMVFPSCIDDDQSRPELQLDCMYSYLADMQNIKDTARFGDVDGTYTYESASNLDHAMMDLQTGVSLARADRLFLQFEVDNYCINAQKALEDFESSIQITLPPGTPAELKVFGIDQKGHVEFGSDPAFGGGDAFTVESWIKYDEGFFESAIGDFIATFNNVADPYEGWMINFLGENLRATIGMGPQSGRVLEFGGIYPKSYGEWNHLAMVYDAGLAEHQLKMYVNGELLFAKTNDITNAAGELQAYQPNVVNTSMWAFMEPTDQSRCMTGYIKKFRMWSAAKSMNEINTLMAGDVSGDEADMICAWDFVEMPEDISNIPDLTGKFTATIVGKHKWFPVSGAN